MKLYKLTDENGQTYNNTQWGEGISHSGTGKGELCSEGWIHAYTHPLLAVLLNPIHADFKNPRMWEAEGDVDKRDGQLKVGCRTLTTIKEIPLPVITAEQRVKFAILCANAVCDDERWNEWADKWLDGTDRSKQSANAARAAAWAANAAEAAWAAEAAAEAAEAAARAAAWAAEAAEARAAADAAEAAKTAARAAAAWAAKAAKTAAKTNKELDLAAIVESCIKD